jgi:hypothetical protein
MENYPDKHDSCHQDDNLRQDQTSRPVDLGCAIIVSAALSLFSCFTWIMCLVVLIERNGLKSGGKLGLVDRLLQAMIFGAFGLISFLIARWTWRWYLRQRR